MLFPMETVFFYTFSTIAQTLAGAIALLAAFVLYRLQGLNTDIDENSMRLSLPLNLVAGESAGMMHRQGQHRQLLELAARTEIPPGTYRADEERARLPTLLDRKDTLLRWLYIALALTVGLITASVLLLMFTPRLATIALASTILVVTLFWFVACMISYVLLLRKVFQA
jgi:hypothetical protein